MFCATLSMFQRLPLFNVHPSTPLVNAAGPNLASGEWPFVALWDNNMGKRYSFNLSENFLIYLRSYDKVVVLLSEYWIARFSPFERDTITNSAITGNPELWEKDCKKIAQMWKDIASCVVCPPSNPSLGYSGGSSHYLLILPPPFSTPSLASSSRAKCFASF